MDLSSFYSQIHSNSSQSKELPPVHLWNPDFCGDMDIRIDRDGLWFHEGTRITRQTLVDLFSTILKREGDEYFLVTPVEKCRIQVAVAPLKIVKQEVTHPGSDDQTLFLTTEQGMEIQVGAGHELSIKTVDNEPYPVVHARNKLDALVTRNVYYQLSEYLEAFTENVRKTVDDIHNPSKIPLSESALGIRSQRQFFVLSELG